MSNTISKDFLVALCFLCCFAFARGSSGRDTLFSDCIFVVDIRDFQHERMLAASVSAGLINRFYQRPAAFVLLTEHDWKWVASLREDTELSTFRWIAASDADIIAYAVAIGAANSVIGYNPLETWSLATVVTLAGINDAIPVPNIPSAQKGASTRRHLLQHTSTNRLSIAPFLPQIVATNNYIPPRGKDALDWGLLQLELALDCFGNRSAEGEVDPFVGAMVTGRVENTAGRWKDELDATLWAWEHLAEAANNSDKIIATQRPRALAKGFLADYIVANRLFVFFLDSMCRPGPQQILYRSMVNRAYQAGKQLRVLGYSTEDEVVADCSLHHTEMSIVSDWSPNLSFYSLMRPLALPLQQAAVQPAPLYDARHTYLAIINSDGDNLQMENNGNREGMEARVRVCQQPGAICPPLSWTISNQLITFGPFMLRWFFSQALKTGRDSFLMGPSGFGFLHPAAIRPGSPLLDEFVNETVAAAQQLSMTAYVHWDIDENHLHRPPQSDFDQLRAFSWAEGEEARGQAQDWLEATRADNRLARNSFILKYDGTAVDTVFAPGEYSIPRWVGNVAGIPEQYRWGVEMPTEKAAKAANELERGTVGYVYKIFNVAPEELETFAKLVDSHVKVVDYRQLHDIAWQKRKAEQG